MDAKRPRIQTTDISAALVKFIVKERLPISKIDSIYLNDLISGALFFFVCAYDTTLYDIEIVCILSWSS